MDNSRRWKEFISWFESEYYVGNKLNDTAYYEINKIYDKICSIKKGEKMPDIAKCGNEICKRKTKCYRYTVNPSEYWQSYTNFSGAVDCEGFMPNKYFAKKNNENTKKQ